MNLIDVRQVSTQIIGFLLMVWILRRYAWGPVVGMLEFDCVPVRDHYLICFTAPVGSPSCDAMRLLAASGAGVAHS